MKKIALISMFLLALGTVPMAFAQNHGEAGVFADYIRLHPSNSNHFGVGGRLSINVHPNVQLEAEMAYDFARKVNETFTAGSTATGSGSITTTRLRILHGLFGPKFQTGGQAIRGFFTIKGGFMNFRLDNRPATFATFTSSIDALRANNVDGVLYPGGGIELYAGPIGIRGEVGDEIYFSNGAHNNLRVAIGPSIRF
jgi:hypothetical protein